MADAATLPRSEAGSPAPSEGVAAKEARIQRNFAEYDHYVQRAEKYLAKGELEAASAHCAIASHIATQNHCGVFWGPRLE